MPLFDCVKGVKVSELVSVLPEKSVPILEYAPNLLTEKTARRMARETGFQAIRAAKPELTVSDMFAYGAENILARHKREDIAAIVFVTQSPDYDLPATSHILQHRLGLSNYTLCLDINEGCSGFITGLYEASELAAKLKAPVLLGAGDTASRHTSPNERGTRCILADGACAALIEPGEQDIPFTFVSYGDRSDVIIMRNSAYRISEHTEDDGFTKMDGVGVLNFALDDVSRVITDFMNDNKLTDEDISMYACHQANKLVINSLADKLHISRDKMPFTAADVGNTSSASIPSVISRTGGGGTLNNVLCCGFGVGMSIGVCLADFSRTNISEMYI